MQCQEGRNWVLINQETSHFNGDVEGDEMYSSGILCSTRMTL